jgi:aryl-alcohol dehydrogenase-like predicted oxidoreductase
VRYLGLSNADGSSLRRAAAVHPISVLQSEYSLFARESESLFGTLDELGIGFVAYSPLARGFLSGAVAPRSAYDASDFRQRIGWWAPGNYEANVDLVARLTALAESLGLTLAQLSLAWLLTRREDLIPIPGSRNPERVGLNVGAADVTLTPEVLAQIDAIVPVGGVGGRA